MIRNIIWDVDGALFDTYPAITYAFNKVLSGMGFSVAMNVIDGLVRLSFEQCVNGLSERFKLDPELLRQKFEEYYLTISPAKQAPIPGASEVCKFIHLNGGRNFAATCRTKESANNLIDAHAMSDLFTGIVDISLTDTCIPDPAVIRQVMDAHNMDPAETLLVSDHELEIQAGRSAGVATCSFGRENLSVPADIMVENYDGLLVVLQGDDPAYG